MFSAKYRLDHELSRAGEETNGVLEGRTAAGTGTWGL